MSARAWKWWVVTALLLAAALGWLLQTDAGQRVQFVLGGALVNLGYGLQDHLAEYDFEHDEHITPEQVWDEMLRQNRMAAAVRERFPRTPRHALVALVVCMDARLDTNDLAGDTRLYYYVLRTAGSVLEAKEAEMLELAVESGVKVVVFSTHSDCAAERAAGTAELAARYPALSRAVAERGLRMRDLLQRPAIAARLASGELLVKHIDIDTMTERIRPR